MTNGETRGVKSDEMTVKAEWQIVAGAYLVALLGLALYAIVTLWPVEPAEVINFLWWNLQSDAESSWMLLVFAAGILGGLIHAMRSFYWYIGNRKLVKSWLAMYLLLPLLGGALSLVFYIIIRGGLLSGQLNGQSITDSLSPIGFTAVGVLVGMFSEQAILKLKDVADTLFAKPEPGEDSKPQESVGKPTGQKPTDKTDKSSGKTDTTPDNPSDRADTKPDAPPQP